MRFFPVLIPLLLAAPAAVAAPGKLSEILVDMDEEKQSVREVLRRLQAAHGLNYVVSEELLDRAGSVTVKLSQVPLDDALDAICIASGLSIQFRGTIVIMLPAGVRAPLARVKDGLIERGTLKIEPLVVNVPRVTPESFKAAKRREPASPSKPAPRASRRSSAMMVGNVVEIDLEAGRLQLVAGGLKRDFYLSSDGAEHSVQFDRLRNALAIMQKGHRVALLYVRTNNRSIVTDLIGGDHVRDSEIPTRKRRPRRGPPRLRRGGPEDGSAPKARPARLKKVEPYGVLAGTFVGQEGDVVKIKRADGVVVDCYLPVGDEAARAKIEAILVITEVGARLFMTYDEEGGKVILRGGISEN